jgi:hypothetical protein
MEKKKLFSAALGAAGTADGVYPHAVDKLQ